MQIAKKHMLWIHLAITLALAVVAFVTGYHVLFRLALLYMLFNVLTQKGSRSRVKEGVTRLSKSCRIATPDGRKHTSVCLIDAATRGLEGVIVEIGGQHYAHWEDVGLDEAKARAEELWPDSFGKLLGGYWVME